MDDGAPTTTTALYPCARGERRGEGTVQACGESRTSALVCVFCFCVRVCEERLAAAATAGLLLMALSQCNTSSDHPHKSTKQQPIMPPTHTQPAVHAPRATAAVNLNASGRRRPPQPLARTPPQLAPPVLHTITNNKMVQEHAAMPPPAAQQQQQQQQHAGPAPAAAADDWRDVQLFGGAMAVRLPQRFQDLSDVREVPDHQEVWADPHTDQSVIVEIAEHSSSVADADIGRFAFEDLAAANEASSSSISSIQQLGAGEVPHLPPGTPASLVTGRLLVAKGRDAAADANSVLLLLAVLRLRLVESDLLVSVNAPLCVAPGSSAALAVAGEQPGAGPQAAALMQGVLGSLRVCDWGLFGGGGGDDDAS